MGAKNPIDADTARTTATFPASSSSEQPASKIAVALATVAAEQLGCLQTEPRYVFWTRKQQESRSVHASAAAESGTRAYDCVIQNDQDESE